MARRNQSLTELMYSTIHKQPHEIGKVPIRIVTYATNQIHQLRVIETGFIHLLGDQINEVPKLVSKY